MWQALPLYEQAIDAGDAELRRIMALALPPKPAPGTVTHPSQLSAGMLSAQQRQRLMTLREEVSLRRATCAQRAVAIRRALGPQAPPPYLAAVSTIASLEVAAYAEESSGTARSVFMENRVAYCVSVRELRGVGPADGLMHGISLDQHSETTLGGAGQAGLKRGGAQVIVAPSAAACAGWTAKLASMVRS